MAQKSGSGLVQTLATSGKSAEHNGNTGHHGINSSSTPPSTKRPRTDEQPGRRPPCRRKPQERNARQEQGNQDRDKLVEAAAKLTLKLADEHQLLLANRLAPMMCGWIHGGRQHDIYEFFYYLMCRFGDSPFHGIWNARLMEAGRLQYPITGVCEQMILLDVPVSGSWQLQAAIACGIVRSFLMLWSRRPNGLHCDLTDFSRRRQDSSAK